MDVTRIPKIELHLHQDGWRGRESSPLMAHVHL